MSKRHEDNTVAPKIKGEWSGEEQKHKETEQRDKSEDCHILCLKVPKRRFIFGSVALTFLVSLVALFGILLGISLTRDCPRQEEIERLGNMVKEMMINQESNLSLIHELREKTNNQSKEISDLQLKYDSVAAIPQDFVEMKIDSLREELTATILSYHHLSIENATALVTRLSQDTNASIGEILLQLENIIIATDQRISYVNQTAVKLSAKSEQIEAELYTLNISHEELREESYTNISKVESSLNQHISQQAALNNQLAEVNTRQDGNLSVIQTDLSILRDEQDGHEDRIRRLEGVRNAELGLTSSITIVCVTAATLFLFFC